MDNNDDNDNDDDASTSTSSTEPLTAEEGLSASSLAALMQFQNMGGCHLEDEDIIIPQNAVCATFTANDSKVIAETYNRLQKKADDSAMELKSALLERKLLELVAPTNNNSENSQEYLKEILATEGVLRVDNVLSAELCDQCLLEINRGLVWSEEQGTTDGTTKAAREHNGFGNVFARDFRYDMYLRKEGAPVEALKYMLHQDSTLGGLFHACLNGQPGPFHEFSALISDAGSKSQPIHPDSPYSEYAPLWTVFIALQDVEMDMGPTIFLPRTNTQETHERLKPKSDKTEKNAMLASCEYRRSLLKKGDAAVMDSRTLHFGDANESSEGKRRVLLYFTIRNPKHSITGADEDYPACGSKWPDLHMSTHDYY